MSTDQSPTTTWRGVVWGTVSEYSHFAWLVPFVLNGVVGALAVAAAIHLYVAEVPALAAAEAKAGTPLASTIAHPVELLAYATVIPLAAVASLVKYISGR